MANYSTESSSHIDYSFTRSAEASHARRSIKEIKKKGRNNKLIGSTAVLLTTGALLIGIAGKSSAEGDNNSNKNFEKIEQVHKSKQEKHVEDKELYSGYELSKSAKKQLEMQMPKIEKLKPLYKQAAAETDMPWQIIAAIHYEEANNDPNMSAFGGETLDSLNPDGQGINGFAPADQLKNYIAALEHVRAMGKWVYGTRIDKNTKDPDKLKKGFTAYHRGTIYKDAGLKPEDNPYVYSGLSKNGKDYSCIFPDADPLAGRVDKRPGALAVVIYLMRNELEQNK